LERRPPENAPEKDVSGKKKEPKAETARGGRSPLSLGRTLIFKKAFTVIRGEEGGISYHAQNHTLIGEEKEGEGKKASLGKVSFRSKEKIKRGKERFIFLREGKLPRREKKTR